MGGILSQLGGWGSFFLGERTPFFSPRESIFPDPVFPFGFLFFSKPKFPPRPIFVPFFFSIGDFSLPEIKPFFPGVLSFLF